MKSKELKAKVMQLLTEAEEAQNASTPNIEVFEAKMAELAATEKEIEKAERNEAAQESFSVAKDRYRKPATGVSNIGRSDDGKFESFGHFLKAVAFHALGRRDSRLEQYSVMPSETQAIVGMSETIPSEGGFLVDKDVANDLLTQALSQSVLYPRCRKIQISSASNGVKINTIDQTNRATGSRWGGVQVYWATEAPTYTTTKKPKFRQVELSLKKLIGMCYATDELIQDASALQGVISLAFSDEFQFVIDDAILQGTGAGQPLGVLNAGCLVSVAKETDQDADTVVMDNVTKMDSRLWAKSANAPGTVWLINQNCKPQMFKMAVVVGAGGAPVWLPAGGIAGNPFGALMGRSVIPIEQCAAVGTVGDIVLFDGSQYIVAEKGGLVASSSMHVAFSTDEQAFKFVLRMDGQPFWASALTPYKGTADTQSPFIALASRD